MSKRENGKWAVDTPDQILPWLWAHDGQEAVVVDDGIETYYCGTEAMRADYRAKGKKAEMFADLGKILFDKENLGAE